MTTAQTQTKGLIFDIQRFSLHDGPGIRTVVFFKGCPLRCRWCANPESLTSGPQLFYSKKDCIGCRQCVDACQVSALSFNDGVVIDRQKCTLSFECVSVCPSGALTQSGKWYSVQDIMDIVVKDLPFFKNSGGGITLSGGEALSQSVFAAELLKEAKASGIHTAVETSGYCTWEALESVLKYTDLLLFDVKLIDEQKHREYTGVSNARILENLKKAAAMGATLRARIPVVVSANSDDESISAFIETLNEYGVKDVDLLPFHQLGAAKYEMAGVPYTFEDEKPPTDELLEKIKNQMQDNGFNVSIGG